MAEVLVVAVAGAVGGGLYLLLLRLLGVGELSALVSGVTVRVARRMRR